MKYFDTSALIRAARLQWQPEGITRPHSLAEFYSFFTGGGFLVNEGGINKRKALSPAVAVELAKITFKRIEFQELDDADVFAALAKAAQKNILGRNIHDFLHVAAAEKSGCKTIVTTNEKDFKTVTRLKVVNASEEFAV